MKIVKNNQFIVGPKGQDKSKIVIRSFKNKIKHVIESVVNAMDKESVLFRDAYWIDRYSTLHFLCNMDRANLFSPLRLLLASEDINNVFIEGYNPMQYAIKTNNREAFFTLLKSNSGGGGGETLINAYNESKTVNTIGTCLSLYLQDVWEGKLLSLSFTFFKAVAEHPSCVFDTLTQLEKWSDKILINLENFTFNNKSISWACYMESYGNKSTSSEEILSESSEPGSIFFIQTILDRFLKNEKEKDSIDIKNLVVDTLGFSVDKSLSRSTSTLLDFPNLDPLPRYYDTKDSLLHVSILTHGTPSTKVGEFFDSYGTFEKLCYHTHPKQNKFGLTALMLCAMRGWKTFALLLDKIRLDPNKVSESARLDYFNQKDNLGRTALDYAVLYPEMQEYLKSIGCVSGKPITVSANNSNLLGGIEKYKSHPKYKDFPTLWLETYYGDIDAVQSTSLKDKEYTFLPIEIKNTLINNTDLVGYFGLPLLYEFGNTGLNSYPQDLAIILGNSEMYSTWNKKLYTKTGLVKPEITVGSNIDITTILKIKPGLKTIDIATLVYLNTQERNFVTVFGTDQILTQYLDFLYFQVNKNKLFDYLIMSEYVLNENKKKILKDACVSRTQSSDYANINFSEFKDNWEFNICFNAEDTEKATIPLLEEIRYPSSNQTKYCGCCYSVATMTMIDLNLSAVLKDMNLPTYKPKQRLGAQSYQMPLSCMQTGGCFGGGSIRNVLRWHQDNYSVPLECIPYQSWKYVQKQQEAGKPIENNGRLEELCPFSTPSDCVKNAIKITSDSETTYKLTTMSNMLKYVNLGVSLVAVMRLTNDFVAFSGSEIYKRGTGTWFDESVDPSNLASVTNPYISKSSSHVVVIIGYGEENGVKYWVILNSYGDVYDDFLGGKDEKGNPKKVPYCRVIRGTDDLGIESSGAYVATSFQIRNADGTKTDITPKTWPLGPLTP